MTRKAFDAPQNDALEQDLLAPCEAQRRVDDLEEIAYSDLLFRTNGLPDVRLSSIRTSFRGGLVGGDRWRVRQGNNRHGWVVRETS